MKYLSLLLLFVASIGNLYAQADLVVSLISTPTTEVNKGDVFELEFTVTNIGNIAAASNHAIVSFTPDLNVDNEEIVSSVSVKSLSPNESQVVSFVYPVSNQLSSGSYFITVKVDPFDVVPENDEDNLYCYDDGTSCATFDISDIQVASQKYNYPILFIHGWSSNSQTWDAFTTEAQSYYGWSYGGRLDYCLNPDNDQNTSDGYIDAWTNPNELVVGDYYTVNFDISYVGDLFPSDDGIFWNDSYSNQSAIVKQGWAVHNAIEDVLAVTGAEKVILVGHSMGGLASREYLQNSTNWQSDGAHHVAKLLTAGTPSGGSNATSGGFSGLFTSMDESSEAVRDLRYNSFLFNGVYLDGGVESDFLSNFYNNDIDCNGFTGDELLGLNQKYSPTDVAYSCIVGVGNNLPLLDGDGVVSAPRADLNNYLIAQPPLANPSAPRFDVLSAHTGIHTENHAIMMRGLDEPGEYELAYPMEVDKLNFGYCTQQEDTSDVDWDEFLFEIPVNATVTISVSNLPVNIAAINLYDENIGLIQSSQSEGASNIELTEVLAMGTYRLEIGGLPTYDSWRFPYAFEISYEEVLPLAAMFKANTQEGCLPLSVDFANNSGGEPSDYSWTFEGGNPNVSTQENPTITYSQPGTYSVELMVSDQFGNSTVVQSDYITVGTSPTADFEFDIQMENMVEFVNLTLPTGFSTEYLWDFGDNQTSTLEMPSHTYLNDGTYTVTMTATNLCGNTSESMDVSIMTVSTEDLQKNISAHVYPNPVSNSLNLQLKGLNGIACDLRLENTLGVLVQEFKVIGDDQVPYTFDISLLDSGTYYLTIEEGGGRRIVRKIVINRG